LNKLLFPYLFAAIIFIASSSVSACRSIQEHPLPDPITTAAPVQTIETSFPIEFIPLPSPSLTPHAPTFSVSSAVPESPTPSPTSTQSPSPTATPTQRLKQLTGDGCCTRPFWSPDGQEVLFFDKPSPELPAGLWAIELNTGDIRLITERVGIYSNDLSWAAFLINGQTVVERLSDGDRYTIPNDGRAVSFSPTGDRLAWTAGRIGPPIDTALREIWVSGIDGSHPTHVFSAYGAVLTGWTGDGRLLVRGSSSLADEYQTYWSVDPAGGSAFELGRGFILRGGVLSPEGSWLAYQSLFSEQSSENGLWVSDLSNGEIRRLDIYGSYRWRDDRHLLIFSPDPITGEHHIWQVEASTGHSTLLRGLEGTGHKISMGDWQVSPSAECLVFVSASDSNLWLLHLDPPVK
jgi:hypothetical protein